MGRAAAEVTLTLVPVPSHKCFCYTVIALVECICCSVARGEKAVALKNCFANEESTWLASVARSSHANWGAGGAGVEP